MTKPKPSDIPQSYAEEMAMLSSGRKRRKKVKPSDLEKRVSALEEAMKILMEALADRFGYELSQKKYDELKAINPELFNSLDGHE